MPSYVSRADAAMNAPLEWLVRAIHLQMPQGVLCDLILRSALANGGGVEMRPGLWRFYATLVPGVPPHEWDNLSCWFHETHPKFPQKYHNPVDLAALGYVPRYGRNYIPREKPPFPEDPHRRAEILALGFDTWYAGLAPELDSKEEEV